MRVSPVIPARLYFYAAPLVQLLRGKIHIIGSIMKPLMGGEAWICHLRTCDPEAWTWAARFFDTPFAAFVTASRTPTLQSWTCARTGIFFFFWHTISCLPHAPARTAMVRFWWCSLTLALQAVGALFFFFSSELNLSSLKVSRSFCLSPLPPSLFPPPLPLTVTSETVLSYEYAQLFT